MFKFLLKLFLSSVSAKNQDHLHFLRCTSFSNVLLLFTRLVFITDVINFEAKADFCDVFVVLKVKELIAESLTKDHNLE